MKKKIVTGLLLIVIFTVTGCGTDRENPALAQSGSEVITGEEESAQEGMKQPKGDTYTWQEITITLPETWKDRYMIQEEENGFSIIQKASYEVDENYGYLFGFYRDNEFVNYGAGETLLAYTPEGVFYYLMQPTDVSFYYEDEDISQDYGDMSEDMLDIVDSIQINVEDISFDGEEYILPHSSFQTVSPEELLNLTDNELMIAKNEIYARHGRKFENSYLQSYFDTCSWYQGSIAPETFEEDELSQTEKDNLQSIVSAQKEYAANYPYPVKYQVPSSASEDLNGDGIKENISFQVTEKPDGEYLCEITVDDVVYDLSQDFDVVLVSPVEDCFYITDLLPYDNELEIAVLDMGPSNDLTTQFFYYDGGLNYSGGIDGFPFADQNQGIDGFTNQGGVYGTVRTDLIETAYVSGFWRYDSQEHQLIYQDMMWHNYTYYTPHELYEDLPVHRTMDEKATITTIPKQKAVYFMYSDNEEWICVKGKDGSKGYMQVKDGEIVDLSKPAEEVFSDLYFFD